MKMMDRASWSSEGHLGLWDERGRWLQLPIPGSIRFVVRLALSDPINALPIEHLVQRAATISLYGISPMAAILRVCPM
jgi:hypothetical protein